MKRALIIVTLLAFTILTVIAVINDGLTGIFGSIFSSWGSLQIFADLVIALVLVIIWMWHDAKVSGRNPWGWIIATLAIGVFSPLVYLLVYKTKSKNN
ncbi:MAG TPA: hypothetical protein PK090_09185 [Smithellaceae bacterium]|nr:hypothetical protein [Smithellaceae bacterium]